MICQSCQKNVANIHVTEVLESPADGASDTTVQEQHLCENCAQTVGLPNPQVQAKKTMQDIWKLLQLSTQTPKQRTIVCPSCGMSLEELRRNGRLGCSKDYEVFKDYLGELLERMHGASAHVGRIPGLGEGELEQMQRVTEKKQHLARAIREEDYETAAQLRDELKELETELDQLESGA